MFLPKAGVFFTGFFSGWLSNIRLEVIVVKILKYIKLT